MSNYPEIPENINVTKKPEKRRLSFLVRKPRHLYGDQLLCLLCLCGMAFWRCGPRFLGLGITAVLISVLVDIACCSLTKKVYNPKDLSTVTSGICLALLSPASISYTLLMFGCALAIGVKHIFGGKDNYIFNPTAVSFAFLIICYPEKMLYFPRIGDTLPLFGEAGVSTVRGVEYYLLNLGTFTNLSSLDILIGNFSGPAGTNHVLILIVCAFCLLFRRSISTLVTVSCLSVISIFRILFPVYDNITSSLVLELVGGYLLFGLLFLANDPQTVPKSGLGKLYYGVFLGFLTVVFRGKVEGWFIFALLACNTLSLRMDIIAEKTLNHMITFNNWLKERLSAYERFSEDARSGKTPNLFATQEIVIDPSNYDMPPINNKVIKIKRKRRNVLAVVNEKIGSLLQKIKKSDFPADLNDVKPASDNISFAVVSYKVLYESSKTAFSRIKKKFRGDTPNLISDKPKEVKAETDESSQSDIEIIDFEETKKETEEPAEIVIADFEEISNLTESALFNEDELPEASGDSPASNTSDDSVNSGVSADTEGFVHNDNESEIKIEPVFSENQASETAEKT